MPLLTITQDCVLNPNDAELRSTLDIWCRRVGEVLKEIMVVVQPSIPHPPHPAPAPILPLQATSTATNTNTNNTTTLTTMTDTDDLSNNSDDDTSVKNTLDEDNDDTGSFSGEEEEEELDFVVSALNVFNALEDLRGVTQKTFSVKRFHKASHVVLSSTATLLDVSQNMSLVQSTPRLRGALESLVAQLRQLQAGPLVQETVMGKLEAYVCELEEAVGECVDEFRSANNPLEGSVVSDATRDVGELRDAPPSPRRKPISRDDSFRETADKKVPIPSSPFSLFHFYWFNIFIISFLYF